MHFLTINLNSLHTNGARASAHSFRNLGPTPFADLLGSSFLRVRDTDLKRILKLDKGMRLGELGARLRSASSFPLVILSAKWQAKSYLSGAALDLLLSKPLMSLTKDQKLRSEFDILSSLDFNLKLYLRKALRCADLFHCTARRYLSGDSSAQAKAFTFNLYAFSQW